MIFQHSKVAVRSKKAVCLKRQAQIKMSVSTSEGLRQMLGKVIIVLCFLPSLDVIRSMQLKNAFAIQAKYRNDKAGKHFNLLDNERLFDSIKEYQDPEETSTTTRKSKSEITDIKETLLKLLSRINALDKKQNDYYISEAPTAGKHGLELTATVQFLFNRNHL